MSKKILAAIIIPFCFLYAYMQPSKVKFLEMSRIRNSFIVLDIREKISTTTLTGNNGEKLVLRKEVPPKITCDEETRENNTKIILSYNGKTAVIPSVAGDMLFPYLLKTDNEESTFWYLKGAGLGNMGRYSRFYLIGIHKGEPRYYMSDAQMSKNGYNNHGYSPANDVFISADGTLIISSFRKRNAVADEQAKLVWNGNDFEMVIGDYRRELRFEDKYCSWPYYKF